MPVLDPYDAYLAAGTSFSRLAPLSGTNKTVYGTFNEDRRTLLPFVDTGMVYPGPGNAMGDPSLLKYFYSVRFGGSGKLYIRAMVDDTEVQRGFVTLSEDPYQASVFHLPRGCAGYGLRLQWVGLAWWRYYEISWDPVTPQGGA